MLFNLIIGALAGYVARFVEEPLGKLIPSKYEMDKHDLRVLSFIVLLLAASVLIGIAGTDGKPFALLVGGAIGIFFNFLLKVNKFQFMCYRVRHHGPRSWKPSAKEL